MITVNGIQIEPTIFPDNTSQVWKLPDELFTRRHVFIKWEYSHEAEFMHIAQLHDLLSANGVNANLELTYLPYARQDKEINNKQTFALRTFARLLNALNFYKVTCMDPHSRVATKLINNFVAEYPIELITRLYQSLEYPLICYPDAGAGEKYNLILSLPMIFGEKERDQLTGKILNYKLVGSPKDKSVLIVDDICDGGATFVILAKALYEAGAKEVNLFVTHGLFSKGLVPLKNAGINRVFTKDGEALSAFGSVVYKPYGETK